MVMRGINGLNAMKFLFIRHGKTKSNMERRYIGDPDEPLCQEGVLEAADLAGKRILPPVAALYCGPALRCRQTSDIMYPGIPYKLCTLGEIDFGIFKHKNADELAGNKEYEKWLETYCMGDIPGGDSVTEYKTRCCGEFLRIAGESAPDINALIIHGGNIMAILERLAVPKRDFYDYHIPNCGAILCGYDNGALYVECIY